MGTIFWHDYETTGTSPALDRPLQFAGIRTDENLEIIGDPVMLYCRPPRDILPHPEACLITEITPQTAEQQGLPEPAFIAEVVAHLARPGTCGAGYNSIRFDDEVTRYTLYRNFLDPYEREWQGGNSRWDIIDMLRLTYALRPDGIAWPGDEDGQVSFRLERLTEANGIGHEAAHDALSDVQATIAMARLVRERQPRLYDYVFKHRGKQAVAGLLDVHGKKPFLHVSTRLPRENAYTGLMVPLCRHPVNKNAVIAFNLMADPEVLLQSDAGEIHRRVFTRQDELGEGVERIPLKAVHLNRCPVVATPNLLDDLAAERLGIDRALCERHWRRLKDVDLTARLHEVFQPDGQAPDRDVEEALYDGFATPADKALMARVAAAEPEELAVIQSRFSDSRYRELMFRYRARYFPDSLGAEERLVWEEQRKQRLSTSSGGRLGFSDYIARLDALATEYADRPEKLKIIDDLRSWGHMVMGGR